MHNTLSKLWIQIDIVTSFSYYIVWVHTVITQKLPVIFTQTFYVSNGCSTTGDVYFLCLIELDARYDWRVWLQTQIAVSFWLAICAYLHAQLENYRSYMTFCIWKNCCIIGDIERSDWKAMAPDMCIGCFMIQCCVSILHAHTYTVIWCTIMHDNNTHITYDYILLTQQQFNCQLCIVSKEQSWKVLYL